MTRTKWSEEDQLVALYLAKRGSSDPALEDAFISSSGHTRKSLKMAVSNFRHLMGERGLPNVSVRQKKIHKSFGSLAVTDLRRRILIPEDSAPVISQSEPQEVSSSGRRLTESELEKARAILAMTRNEIARVAGDDKSLLWALRRKVYKELVYDERSKPMARRMLKFKLFARQKGLCAGCTRELPEKYSILDRREAMKGYTEENCKLLCSECDQKAQAKRKYA